jgi:hypothetical protein
MDSSTKETIRGINIELNDESLAVFLRESLDGMMKEKSLYETHERDTQLLSSLELQRSRHHMNEAVRIEHRAGALKRNSTLASKLSRNASEEAFNDSVLLRAILLNASVDQSDYTELQHRLQALNASCFRGFYWMCNLVGGSVRIKKRADADSIKMVHEFGQADIVRDRADREQANAQILEDRAVHFNRTAEALLKASARYEDQARTEALLAERENASSVFDEFHIQMIKTRAHEITARADQRFSNIEQRLKSERKALGVQSLLTIVCALCALLYFAWRIGLQLWWLARKSTMPQEASIRHRRAIQGVVHVFVFLLCLGSFEESENRSNLLLQLHECIRDVAAADTLAFASEAFPPFDVESAGAVSLAFAVKAALLQAFVVHTIPLLRSNWPCMLHNQAVVAFLLTQSTLNCMWWFALFSVETLLLLFLVPPLLLSALLAYASSTTGQLLLWAGLCACMVVAREPRLSVQRELNVREEGSLVSVDDELALCSWSLPFSSMSLASISVASVDSSSSMASGVVPVCGYNPRSHFFSEPSPEVHAESFQKLVTDFSTRGSAEATETAFTVANTTASMHAVSPWSHEFSKLLLPTHILLACILVTVTQNSLLVLAATCGLWGFLALMSLAILVCILGRQIRRSMPSFLQVQPVAEVAAPSDARRSSDHLFSGKGPLYSSYQQPTSTH